MNELKNSILFIFKNGMSSR